MQSIQFSNSIIYPQDKFFEDQKREKMMHLDDYHDKMCVEMVKQKDESVKTIQDEYDIEKV